MSGAATLESRLIIAATDKTGVVIDALAGKIEALEKKIMAFEKSSASADKALGKGFGQAAQKVDALGRAIGTMDGKARGIERVAAAFHKIGTAAAGALKVVEKMGNNLTPFAIGAGAFGHKAFKAGATLQDQEFAMRSAGIGAEEMGVLRKRADELSGRYKQVSIPEILQIARETRSVLTHTDEVPHFMEPMVRAKVALDAMDPEHHASEGLGLLVRGAESIGAAQDPERFEKLLDSYVKANQVMGRTINPEQIYDFNKYLKNSGAQLSDRFLMTSGLSLAQEIGGSSAGNSINMAGKYVRTGWGQSHGALNELVRLGLVSADDVETNKNGSVKGIKAGRQNFLQGQQQLLSDPDQWTYNTALPAMIAHGATSTNDQLALFEKIFPKSDAATFFGKILTQRAAFENHAKLYGNAMGLSAADQNGDQASQQLGGLATQMQNWLAVAASPLMTSAAQQLGVLSDAMNSLREDAKENPSHGSTELAGGTVAAGLAGVGIWNGIRGAGGVLPFMARTGMGALNFAGRAAGPIGLGLALADAPNHPVAPGDLEDRQGALDNLTKRWGVRPDAIGAASKEAPKVEITGSAQVGVSVEINESMLTAKITRIVRDNLKGVQVNASGPGSAGKTMSDSATPEP